MTDRTVHASGPGIEVVRYQTSGRWYLETSQYPIRPGCRRRLRTVWDAANQTLEHQLTHHPNQPHGQRYDQLIWTAQ